MLESHRAPHLALGAFSLLAQPIRSAVTRHRLVGMIHACLAQLRVASLERLVREVVRIRPDATRADIVTTLEGMGGGVRWYGRSIVAVSQ